MPPARPSRSRSSPQVHDMCAGICNKDRAVGSKWLMRRRAYVYLLRRSSRRGGACVRGARRWPAAWPRPGGAARPSQAGVTLISRVAYRRLRIDGTARRKRAPLNESGCCRHRRTHDNKYRSATLDSSGHMLVLLACRHGSVLRTALEAEHAALARCARVPHGLRGAHGVRVWHTEQRAKKPGSARGTLSAAAAGGNGSVWCKHTGRHGSPVQHTDKRFQKRTGVGRGRLPEHEVAGRLSVSRERVAAV
jgi:hypothetical protein